MDGIGAADRRRCTDVWTLVCQLAPLINGTCKLRRDVDGLARQLQVSWTGLYAHIYRGGYLRMNSNFEPIYIDYYTDVLCIWALIAQPRLEELHSQWGSRVVIRHRYVDIFGDAHGKIARQWGEDDGFQMFAEHVAKSVAPFDQLAVHPDIWVGVRPRSSLSAHMVLKAVELVAGAAFVEPAARRIRHAFFTEARDISDMSLLLEIVLARGIDVQPLQVALRDGSALAALSDDQHSATALGVRGSPTWVLNEGRQVLYGNVGYRILHANIEELAKHPGAEASWC